MKGIHIHERKRLDTDSPFVKGLDKVVIFVSVIFPLLTIPQIYTIYSTQSAQGVSLITWSMFAVCTIPLLLYGIAHKVKPMIVLYAIWLVVYAVLIPGIIVYG